MRNFDVNKGHHITPRGGNTVLRIIGAFISYVVLKDAARSLKYSGHVTYSDAIGAVMDSQMLSSTKNKIVALIAKNRSSDYYKSIIKVVNSDMLGCNKIEAIKHICEEES